MTNKRIEAKVVCEHRLNGSCGRESCAAYKLNTLGVTDCKKLSTGQHYYNYNCSYEKGEVKLLDILFTGNSNKINPNFTFMRKKGKFDF